MTLDKLTDKLLVVVHRMQEDQHFTLVLNWIAECCLGAHVVDIRHNSQ